MGLGVGREEGGGREETTIFFEIRCKSVLTVAANVSVFLWLR